jgi:hypothetical protein
LLQWKEKRKIYGSWCYPSAAFPPSFAVYRDIETAQTPIIYSIYNCIEKRKTVRRGAAGGKVETIWGGSGRSAISLEVIG